MKNHFISIDELLMHVVYGVQVTEIVHTLKHALHLVKLECRFGRKEFKHVFVGR